jgi:hypothetical protein
MKNDIMENSLDPSPHRYKVTDEKLLMGSTIDKYPVKLDDGRTVVYISDKSKEAEIRLKFELLRNKRFPTRCPRHHL